MIGPVIASEACLICEKAEALVEAMGDALLVADKRAKGEVRDANRDALSIVIRVWYLGDICLF